MSARILGVLVLAALVPACGSSGSSSGPAGPPGGGGPPGAGGTSGAPAASLSPFAFPATSTNTLHAVTAIDADTAYAVGDHGVILRTDDGGATWANLSDFTVSDEELYAASFVDADTGWVVGANGTILFTDDGGATWTLQAAPTMPTIPVNHLRGVAAISATQAVAVGLGGIIWRTVDGATWTEVNTAAAPITSADLFGISFLGGTDDGTLVGNDFVADTTNGGATWIEDVFSPAVVFSAVQVMSSTAVYAVGNDNQFHRRDVAAWTAGPVGFAANALSFIDANTGWAVGPLGQIAKTTVGGTGAVTPWTLQDSDTFNQLNGVAMVAGATAADTTGIAVGELGTILTFAVDPMNGDTWTAVAEAPVFDLLGVDARPGTPAFVCAVGTGGTILRSVDGGVTWTEATDSGTTQDLTDVHFPSANVGYAVGNQGIVVKTTDGGDNWTVENGGIPSTNLNAVFFVSESTGVAVGQHGLIVRTTDGGDTWTVIESGLNGEHNHDVDFVDAFTGWIAGHQGILRTLDGGVTWSIVSTVSGGPEIGVDFLGSQIGYLVKDNSVMKTEDGGTTWTPMTLPTVDGDLTALSFVDDFHGYVVTDSGEVLRTDDGLTFTLLPSATSQSLNAVDFVGLFAGWAVGNRGTILGGQ
ncbi:MAG TPA: YCF48-related protein [Planctomycetota bacterium]|nr:YCF48-related protein [Planctomycetota bacterium]